MTQVAKKTPAWMTLSAESVAVTLTKAVEMNGVVCDRSPCVHPPCAMCVPPTPPPVVTTNSAS